MSDSKTLNNYALKNTDSRVIGCNYDLMSNQVNVYFDDKNYVPITKVQELSAAYNEERCFISPVKMGETLYHLVVKPKYKYNDDYTKTFSEFSFIMTSVLSESNFFKILKGYGTTYFKTYEEAANAKHEWDKKAGILEQIK